MTTLIATARTDREAATGANALSSGSGGAHDPVGGSLGGNVDGCVSVILSLSVSELTARAAIVGALALFVLLLVGWRKPARASDQRRPTAGYTVEHRPTPLYRRPGVVHRLLSAAGSGALAVLVGVIVAIMIAFSAAAAVIYLTDLLGS